ncbi:hypothetical protein MOF28_11805 [Bacillus haynesii]|uniref:hypothetical protein n=1 Tax=Bacillus haynesii TaxID=1925021 RepID=UPI00227E7DC6|nr:hypothetical protein [Bacillus haynesii]MCY9339031.1 hypothetical protein [Bacillus haynesii]
MDAKKMNFLLIIHQLDTFKEYAEYIEYSMTKKLDEFNTSFKELDENDLDVFADLYYDEMIQYRDHFPAIMRKSLFISIYSFLEDKVVEYCTSNDNETCIKLNDLKGQGIPRAALFIKKVLRKSFPDQSKEWNYIKKAGLIRNCIVHCQGDIDKTNNKIQVIEAVNELQNVSLNHINFVVLNKEFCFEFIKTVENFLRDLFGIHENLRMQIWS